MVESILVLGVSESESRVREVTEEFRVEVEVVEVENDDSAVA